MEKRRLGQSDLMVSPLCLGGNVFGWTADEATSFKILDGFVDAGLNFIDTADVYSAWVPDHTGGESESIIGRWMKARGTRDRVVVATKVGWERGLSAAHIRTAVEDSLKRLQTDCSGPLPATSKIAFMVGLPWTTQKAYRAFGARSKPLGDAIERRRLPRRREGCGRVHAIHHGRGHQDRGSPLIGGSVDNGHRRVPAHDKRSQGGDAGPAPVVAQHLVYFLAKCVYNIFDEE
jgi:hypothetical protein